MPIVRIARHGETHWNREGCYQGRLDVPLSPLGEQQADALGRSLLDKHIGRIFSSPLIRCIETASPFSEQSGIAIERDERLIEIAHGGWEGKLRDDVMREDPERYYAWKHDPANVSFPGGESLVDVRNRWRSFVQTFAPESDTLIVTHDVVARVAILEATGRELDDLWKPRVVNAGYAEYDLTDGVWRLIHECCDSYLAGLENDISAQAL
jgi:broad specificity phosphatase PhoE